MKRFHETASVGKEKHSKRVPSYHSRSYPSIQDVFRLHVLPQDVAQGVRFKSHDFNCQDAGAGRVKCAAQRVAPSMRAEGLRES